MVHDSHNLHHFHKEHGKSQVLDKIIYVIGVLGPIMTIPQLTNIWIDHNAAGVSVISWSSYLVMAVFWFIYGIIHRIKPIIVTYFFWILIDILIVLGIILFA